jgi:hypothetical protein
MSADKYEAMKEIERWQVKATWNPLLKDGKDVIWDQIANLVNNNSRIYP